MTVEQHPIEFCRDRYWPFTTPNLIVVHWTDGPTLEVADSALRTRGLSAHYGVDGDRVWQWVPEDKIAYHAGDWIVNMRSIGIEHVGMPGQPIKDQSYITSAALIASICQKYGITASPDTIKPHRAFRATDCPGQLNEGGLDVTRLINEVNSLIHAVVTTTPPADPTPITGFPKSVTIQAAGVNVRVSPDHNSALGGSRHLNKGATFMAIAEVVGTDPYGNGQNLWYKSSKGNYVWAGACN